MIDHFRRTVSSRAWTARLAAAARAVVGGAAVGLLACALPSAALAQQGPPQDRYIVVLNEDVPILPEDVATDVAIQTGGQVGYVYDTVLQGFSIVMPRAAAAAIARDPRVAYIEEDIPVSIVEQTVPTGIQRIFADDNTNIGIDDTDDYRIDVDVAVLDTGIDVDHPDLDVVGGANCLQSSGGGPPWARSYYCDPDVSYDDDHYHGTHVAGTVGAIDNGIGVVGVAPGARLWAVKVLDQNGSGSLSGIIEGIEWVVAQGDIEVINMSLGGSGESDAMDAAVADAVNAGVTVVVAAGNSDGDAAGYTPANAPEALTVSALADFDGEPGYLVVNTSSYCRDDQDDTLADFSNYGSTVDIVAPGVCILSTYPNEQGEYGTISGTSMASPHVAGAAALLASAGMPPGTSALEPNTIRSTLLDTGNIDWTDDSGDGIREPLLDVSDTTVFAPVLVAGSGDGGGGTTTDNAPSATVTNPANNATVSGTVNVTADATDDNGVNQVEFFVDGGSIFIDSDGSDGWAASWDTTAYTDSGYTVEAVATDTASQTASDTVSVTVDNTGSGGGGESISYSADIAFQKKGPNLDITVTIRVDNGDGAADPATDNPLADAMLHVSACDNQSTPQCYFQEADDGTTDTNGQRTFKLMHISTSRTYTFTVDGVTHSSHTFKQDVIEPDEWYASY